MFFLEAGRTARKVKEEYKDEFRSLFTAKGFVCMYCLCFLGAGDGWTRWAKTIDEGVVAQVYREGKRCLDSHVLRKLSVILIFGKNSAGI